MTLEDIKNYLRIDDTEEDLFLQSLMEVAEIYIDSCVGEEYKTNDKAIKLAELLQKKIIADLYENRGTTVDNIKKDVIVTTILNTLALYQAPIEVGDING